MRSIWNKHIIPVLQYALDDNPYKKNCSVHSIVVVEQSILAFFRKMDFNIYHKLKSRATS